MSMKIKLYKDDLPSNLKFKNSIAIDTETMGLNPMRDRLCLVQLSSGNDICCFKCRPQQIDEKCSRVNKTFFKNADNESKTWERSAPHSTVSLTTAFPNKYKVNLRFSQ